MLVGDWDAAAAIADETDHAGGIQHLQISLRCSRDADKSVAGEQRNLDHLSPIAPAVHLGEKRKDGVPLELGRRPRNLQCS